MGRLSPIFKVACFKDAVFQFALWSTLPLGFGIGFTVVSAPFVKKAQLKGKIYHVIQSHLYQWHTNAQPVYAGTPDQFAKP